MSLGNLANCSDSVKSEVRLIPDISAAALRHKYQKEISVWYCLRSLNKTGSGFINRTKVLEGMVETFGYTLKTAYRHLELGEHVFWSTLSSKHGAVIKIQGLKDVAVTLDTTLNGNGYFRTLHSSQFNTPAKRKSAVYASIHNPNRIKGNPISRAAIGTYTGISTATQRRYEKTAGVKHVAQFAVKYYEKRQSVDSSGRWVDVDKDTFGIERKGMEPILVDYEGKTAKYRMQQRLPNCYRATTQEPGAPGMIKRVRKAIARSLVSNEATSKASRIYFPSYRRFIRSLKRCHSTIREGWCRVLPKLRINSGRQEWSYASEPI